jgi:hypothetical protein
VKVRGMGGLRSLLEALGELRRTLKSDVDPSGNILFWSDPVHGGLS